MGPPRVSENDPLSGVTQFFDRTVQGIHAIRRTVQCRLNQTEEDVGRLLSTVYRRVGNSVQHFSSSPTGRIAFAVGS